MFVEVVDRVAGAAAAAAQGGICSLHFRSLVDMGSSSHHNNFFLVRSTIIKSVTSTRACRSMVLVC